MTFNECLLFLNNYHKELPTKMSYLDIIDVMIGTAYRQLRARGMTRERVMQLMLWGIFYFVQKESLLTDKDEETIINAMQAVKVNAYFASIHREEEEEE